MDSRTIEKGEFFVPVKGENFDGHKFADDAMSRGAAGIVEEAELYELAQTKLLQIAPVVIAITGSVGKSTMRDFIYTLLSAKHKCTKGTLNTKLGLAVNIVNDLTEDDRFFIAETGMDRPGELLETGKFINPHAIVYTNISESHMEKLGSLEKIKRAKAELIQTVRPGGIIFMNWDNSSIRDIANRVPPQIPIETFGYSEAAKYNRDYVLHLLQAGLTDRSEVSSFDKLPFRFIGKHNYVNALGAISVADYFGITPPDIFSSIEKLTPPKGRMNLIDGTNGSVIVDDTYNSSPESAISAIASAGDYSKRLGENSRLIIVLGGMLELGDYEDEGHKKVGEALSKSVTSDVILVGELAKKVFAGILDNASIRIKSVTDVNLAAEYIKTEIIPKKGDIILIKASQGIRLERLVKLIMEHSDRAQDLLVRQDARWK